MFCHTCGIRNPGGRTTVREEAQRHAGNRIEGTRAETPNTAGAGTCAGSDALDGDPMLANARGGIFDTGAVRLGSGRCAALFRTQPNAACSPPVVRKNPCVFSLRWRAGRVGRRCLWCLRRSAALVGILAAGRLGNWERRQSRKDLHGSSQWFPGRYNARRAFKMGLYILCNGWSSPQASYIASPVPNPGIWEPEWRFFKLFAKTITGVWVLQNKGDH